METNEILERVYFADLFLSRQNIPSLSPQELSEKLDEANEKAETLSLDEIRKEIKKNPVDIHIWLPRYTGYFCKKIKVNPNELCLDDSHAGYDSSRRGLDNINEKRGEKLSKIMIRHKDNPEIIRRNTFVSENFDLLMSKGWVIVRPYNSTSFEVMLGNHRVMVACAKGLREIRVLCLCQEDDSDKCVDFSLMS